MNGNELTIYLYNEILDWIKFNLDVPLLETNIYTYTLIFALCLFLLFIYVIKFDVNSYYKRNLFFALFISIDTVANDSSTRREDEDLRPFLACVLFLSFIWNLTVFSVYYYFFEPNFAYVWLEMGFPVLRVICFYFFWIFFGIFLENFVILLSEEEEEAPVSFMLLDYLIDVTSGDFIYDKYFTITNFLNDKLINNPNTHFAVIWPLFYYFVYFVFLDAPELYVIDYYMLISGFIIFIILLSLMTFSECSSKEISIHITNQLFCVSVGAFLLLISCLCYSDMLHVKFFFLNGHILFSSGAFFFKFWIIFFFMLCMLLANTYVKQSTSSLVELPLLFLVAVMLLLIINGLTDLFAIVLSFEILSLVIIGLCGLTMNKISSEASVKYFSQNSIITGLVLLGVFFYLFLFKNTNLLITKLFIEMIYNFNLVTYCLNVLLFSSIMLWLFSFFFKFGIFPVNFYVADIYNGSSAPVILFISAVIKPTVLFLFYIRIMPLFSEKVILISMIFSFCLSSIVLGEWMSLNTSDIKRFFGHSSVSQYGFIVLSLFSKSVDIALYTLLYLFIYNISLFLIISVLIEHYNYKLNDISKLYFNDLNSYFKYNLSAKLLMTINILIISGLPPFILFLYKYAIFVQIFGSKNYIFLLLIFIFNTGFSSAYYFRIISDIWATNLINNNLTNITSKKNLIFENNTLVNDSLKIYFSWLLLIFFYFMLIKYFDLLYSFGVLIIIDSLLI